jgi:hypothetical protein
MKYRVIKGFSDTDGWKNPGDTVEATGNREQRLRQARVIGATVDAETAAVQPGESARVREHETATKKEPKERRG